ncbi:MAG: ABC transporter permease subunit, partial [Propionibacteriaceae bacterium]|nr:ABC transporter permease subunit [Propionibacteriaceae bacterium]
CAVCAGTIGTLIGYCVSKNRRSRWANFVNNMAFLPYLMPSMALGVAFFIFGNQLQIYGTTLLLVIAGTIKYIPFASRASLTSMLQLSGEIEESAIIQNISWWKRMVRIIIPIQKAAIISGYLLPFMSCIREMTLFMLLISQTKYLTLMLNYFDEMGLYAYSSAINLMLIVIVLVFNWLVTKLTGASIDKGIGGN